MIREKNLEKYNKHYHTLKLYPHLVSEMDKKNHLIFGQLKDTYYKEGTKYLEHISYENFKIRRKNLMLEHYQNDFNHSKLGKVFDVLKLRETMDRDEFDRFLNKNDPSQKLNQITNKSEYYDPKRLKGLRQILIERKLKELEGEEDHFSELKEHLILLQKVAKFDPKDYEKTVNLRSETKEEIALQRQEFVQKKLEDYTKELDEKIFDKKIGNFDDFMSCFYDFIVDTKEMNLAERSAFNIFDGDLKRRLDDRYENHKHTIKQVVTDAEIQRTKINDVNSGYAAYNEMKGAHQYQDILHSPEYEKFIKQYLSSTDKHIVHCGLIIQRVPIFLG